MESLKETRERVVDNIVETRPPLVHERCPMILGYSEKAGCTTAVSWFFWHAGLLDEAVEFHPFVHRYENRVFKKAPAYKEFVKAEMLAGRKPVVKFVRDPYTRTVSSFLALSGEAANEKPNHFTRHLWRRLRGLVHGSPTAVEGISFREFLSCLEVTGVEPKEIDPHIAAQCVSREECLGIEYVALEWLHKEVPRVENELGLEQAPIERLNSKAHHRGVAKGTGSAKAGPDMRIVEQTYYRQPVPAVEAFYDGDTERRVAELFKSDVRTYQAARGHG